MRLTKNIKKVIVAQFKLGDSMQYLADIYGVKAPRVEQVIREAMINSDGSVPEVSKVPAPEGAFQTSETAEPETHETSGTTGTARSA